MGTTTMTMNDIVTEKSEGGGEGEETGGTWTEIETEIGTHLEAQLYASPALMKSRAR